MTMFLKLKYIKVKSDDSGINTELTTFNKVIMWLIPAVPITMLLILILAVMNHVASRRRAHEAARRNVEMLHYFRRHS